MAVETDEELTDSFADFDIDRLWRVHHHNEEYKVRSAHCEECD